MPYAGGYSQQPPYNPGSGYGGYTGGYGAGGGYTHDRDDPFAPPYDGKPPGYVGGGFVEPDAGKKNPFDDDVGERDVTSRPAPGGDETFGGRRA